MSNIRLFIIFLAIMDYYGYFMGSIKPCCKYAGEFLSVGNICFLVVILQFVTLKLNERRMILWKTEL